MWTLERTIYWFLPYAPFLLSAVIAYFLKRKVTPILKPLRYALVLVVLWTVLSWLFLLLVSVRDSIRFGYDDHWLDPYVSWLRVDPIFVGVVPFITLVVLIWGLIWGGIYYLLNKNSMNTIGKTVIGFLVWAPIVIIFIGQFYITFFAV